MSLCKQWNRKLSGFRILGEKIMQSLSSLITKLLKQSLHMYQRGDEIMMMTIFPALYRKRGQRWYVVCENSEKLLCSRAGWFQLKNHILNHSFIKPFIYSFMHAQSCLTFGNPLDGSLPGSSVHGLSRQESWNGLPFCLLHLLHWQADSLPLSHLGSPQHKLHRIKKETILKYTYQSIF